MPYLDKIIEKILRDYLVGGVAYDLSVLTEILNFKNININSYIYDLLLMDLVLFYKNDVILKLFLEHPKFKIKDKIFTGWKPPISLEDLIEYKKNQQSTTS